MQILHCTTFSARLVNFFFFFECQICNALKRTTRQIAIAHLPLHIFKNNDVIQVNNNVGYILKCITVNLYLIAIINTQKLTN